MAIFIPEVFADALQTEFTGKLVLGNMAAVNTDLVGQPGDTVNLPYYNYAGAADVIAAGIAMTPVNLAGSSVQVLIKKAGKAFEVTDEDLNGGVGVQNEIVAQLGRAIAEAIDSELMTKALTSTVEYDGAAAVIGRDAIVEAQAKLGDNADGAVLVIHSKQLKDIYKDSNFVSASQIGSAIMVGGLKAIGTLFGMPVIVSDKVTVTSGTPEVYNAIVMKPGSLALAYKRQPVVETDRDILKGTTVLAANVHFGAALARPAQVVKLITQ